MSATIEREVGGGTRASGAPGRDTSTARLARYAVWQFRDFMRERGVWIAALGLIAIWIFRATSDFAATAAQLAENARKYPAMWPSPTENELFLRSLLGLFSFGSFVSTLIASHGIVSRDRERGYQRFLFAKPVSVVRYYLQSFLVNGAGLLLVLAALIAVTGVAFLRMPPVLPMLAYAGVQYVMIGGLVMLLSTFVRYDFALATLVMGLGAGLRGFGAWRNGFGWLDALASLLPPMMSMLMASDAVQSGKSLAGSLLAPLCYGVLYVAAALFVLRRRSIAT